ncbi:uncharacterized protein JCM6883_000665 [Sporobolomyces salmoneus]|uniref:uncharacterized protein n=1 Tax=Sporobolomyces salmoneus TaxID=183962 RepID=UPI003171E9DF
MARGKGTPKRNQVDPDFSPTSPAPSPSPSTPQRRNQTASSASGTNSPRTAISLSQAQAPDRPTRGPLPASAETTYHQRLRGILLDCKKLRRQWNELVIRGLVGRVRAAIELWVDVESTMKQIQEMKATNKVTQVKAGYLFAQSAKLSDQLEAVEAVFTSLNEVHTGMLQVVERAEWLVVEAAKTRGTLFAFREPMWVTWPLSRFADAIAQLSTPYTSSFTLIRQLLDTLTTFPPLPSHLSPTNETAVIKSASSDSQKQKTKEDKSRPRPTSEQLQASLSLLAVQPLLPGKQGDWGSEGWDELLTVEVGGWGEK